MLTIFSLLASIGTFIIAATQMYNGQYSTFEHPPIDRLMPKHTDKRVAREDYSRKSAAEFCVMVIVFCGAGLAVSRIFR
jgi:hypothetical protein